MLPIKILKGSNLFESGPNIDIYLSAFTALKKSYQTARC